MWIKVLVTDITFYKKFSIQISKIKKKTMVNEDKKTIPHGPFMASKIVSKWDY